MTIPVTGTTGEGTARRQATPFVLSRRHLSIHAPGSLDTFDDPHEAAARLRGGRVPAVVGALPFDLRGPAALTVPAGLHRLPGPWSTASPSGPVPECSVLDRLPSPDGHLQAVGSALRRLRSPDDPLTKVVLARSLVLGARGPIPPAALLHRLVANDPAGNGFCVDLTPAGAPHLGRTLVGSSPELLVRRSGREVSCFPLAGTAARVPDPEQDAAVAQSLTRSVKDLGEHAIVVEGLRKSLGTLCEDLRAPSAPQLVRAPALWHLGTPVTGTLRSERTTALDLALALHPTAAVCGHPRAHARDAIAEIEGDRGFYAGAVGWCDAQGDGEWMVAIRCGEIAADRRSIRVFAGGGIVAQSDPQAELDETSAKFTPMLTALGATEHAPA
ncbi:isochorismate synthase [Streptomyces sp. ATE26]|uniref:isochorismate synthase n=1 Tax=Streptomyces sp. ATE26 TaxID=2954237 RepID=UPI002482A484|nr:isochorismate synthase [Streptomyces sp. ATE26]MDI1457642.1 isochorismate synthase [Streptomyces sp. ATE26]